MPQFPTTENDIVGLAAAMIHGYQSYPSEFPHGDAAGLQEAVENFGNAKLVQDCNHADARDATEAKDAALDALKREMERQLLQSEVDNKDDENVLEYIGWGPPSQPHKAKKPGMPRSLAAVMQAPGTVTLDWKPPARNSGGPVRTYLIYRRDKTAMGGFSDWHQIGMALATEKTLTGQPNNVELEYRVLAVNPAGPGIPGNTAMVVL